MAKNPKPGDEKTNPANQTAADDKAIPNSEVQAADGKAHDNITPFPSQDDAVEKNVETAAHEAAPPEQAAEDKTAHEAEAVQPPEAEAQDKTEPEAPAPEETAAAPKGRGGRPQRAEQTAAKKNDAAQETPSPAAKPGKGAKAEKPPTGDKKPIPAPAQEETPPPEPEKPPEPREAPRPGEKEEIVFIPLADLHAFKNHPFSVRDDEEMRAMVESVKDKGVTQPAIVRPRDDGGYELVSGHRRQLASQLAGYTDMPCIIRNLTDEQAITQMVEDNTNQRDKILPSERAKALKMQLEAIKRQGARDDNGSNGQRSNEIVADRNGMTVKQVQRYIKLNDLVPELLAMADTDKLKFTPAVELAHIGKKNQQYIAVSIEGNQSTPSLSQAQRMRTLDQQGLLKSDTIDGILMEEKKEADKVILSAQELSQYFGKDKTPREMKDTILRLLEENKGKEMALAAPGKKNDGPAQE